MMMTTTKMKRITAKIVRMKMMKSIMTLSLWKQTMMHQMMRIWMRMMMRMKMVSFFHSFIHKKCCVLDNILYLIVSALGDCFLLSPAKKKKPKNPLPSDVNEGRTIFIR